MLFDPFSLVCNTLLLTLALFVQLVFVDVVFPMDVLLQQCASQALQSMYMTLVEPRSLPRSRNPFLTNGGYRAWDLGVSGCDVWERLTSGSWCFVVTFSYVRRRKTPLESFYLFVCSFTHSFFFKQLCTQCVGEQAWDLGCIAHMEDRGWVCWLHSFLPPLYEFLETPPGESECPFSYSILLVARIWTYVFCGDSHAGGSIVYIYSAPWLCL